MWPKGDTDLGEGVLDLGHGVTAHATVDAAGEWVGLIRRHPREGGEGSCASAVAFDTPASRKAHGEDGKVAFHTVVSWEPLTLLESCLCTACGHHGHVREGRWVPS